MFGIGKKKKNNDNPLGLTYTDLALARADLKYLDEQARIDENKLKRLKKEEEERKHTYNDEERLSRKEKAYKLYMEKLERFGYDKWKHIRDDKDSYYEKSNGNNHIILTQNYLIDAWILLAQMVYLSPEKAKAYQKEIDAINYYIEKDLKLQLALSMDAHNIHYGSGSDAGKRMVDPINRLDEFWDGRGITGPSNTKSGYIDNNSHLAGELARSKNKEYTYDDIIRFLRPGMDVGSFVFDTLDTENGDYYDYLKKYCENRGHIFGIFDPLFSVDIAIQLIYDFIDRGFDYNLETFDVTEKELSKCLTLRANHKITYEEFLSLSKYGKNLLARDAAYCEAGVYVYPRKVDINIQKLQSDLENMIKLYICNKYKKTMDELNATMNLDFVRNITLWKLVEQIYPLYYREKDGGVKMLNSFLPHIITNKELNNTNPDLAYWTPRNEVMSYKDVTNHLKGITFEVCLQDIDNYGHKVQLLEKSTNKKIKSNGKDFEYITYAGTKLLLDGEITSDFKKNSFNCKLTICLGDVLDSINSTFSIEDYIDHSEAYNASLNHLMCFNREKPYVTEERTIHDKRVFQDGWIPYGMNPDLAPILEPDLSQVMDKE